MEYVYAALILHETGAEINEQNLSGVLESAGKTVDRSRIKAIVAALEDVDLAATKAKTMASATAGGESAAIEQPADAELGADDGETAVDPADESAGADASDEEDDGSSDALGSLFGDAGETDDDLVEDDVDDSEADRELESDPGDGEVESTDETGA